MLDVRAWIVTCVLLLAAAGAYVIWITRPRVHASVRSLSAARPNSTNQTKMLHVDGCSDDFIVKQGEIVEPKVVPGSSIDHFRSVYGKETTSADGSLTWDRYAYILTYEDRDRNLRVSLNQGHVLETLDGVELGIDSFGTIFHKMRDKQVEIHERMNLSQGKWTLTVSFYSACGHKYRSEYERSIDDSPEVEKLIAPRPSEQGKPGRPGVDPWRSDLFMNKLVSEYTMVPADGHDYSSAGSVSEHN